MVLLGHRCFFGRDFGVRRDRFFFRGLRDVLNAIEYPGQVDRRHPDQSESARTHSQRKRTEASASRFGSHSVPFNP